MIRSECDCTLFLVKAIPSRKSEISLGLFSFFFFFSLCRARYGFIRARQKSPRFVVGITRVLTVDTVSVIICSTGSSAGAYIRVPRSRLSTKQQPRAVSIRAITETKESRKDAAIIFALPLGRSRKVGCQPRGKRERGTLLLLTNQGLIAINSSGRNEFPIKCIRRGDRGFV